MKKFDLDFYIKKLEEAFRKGDEQEAERIIEESGLALDEYLDKNPNAPKEEIHLIFDQISNLGKSLITALEKKSHI